MATKKILLFSAQWLLYGETADAYSLLYTAHGKTKGSYLQLVGKVSESISSDFSLETAVGNSLYSKEVSQNTLLAFSNLPV